MCCHISNKGRAQKGRNSTSKIHSHAPQGNETQHPSFGKNSESYTFTIASLRHQLLLKFPTPAATACCTIRELSAESWAGIDQKSWKLSDQPEGSGCGSERRAPSDQTPALSMGNSDQGSKFILPHSPPAQLCGFPGPAGRCSSRVRCGQKAAAAPGTAAPSAGQHRRAEAPSPLLQTSFPGAGSYLAASPPALPSP